MSLSVENLSFSYRRGAQVLKDITFTVGQGEMMSVLGPNGVGKSTLFKCILGSLTNYSGMIQIDGRDLKSMSFRERAAQLAYIPQTHKPTFSYTVLDTVLMGTTRQSSIFGRPKAAQVRIAEGALNELGIGHLRERDFNRLSGGEQQLVLIARALAQQAKLLVMDEPTSALDYGNQFRVLNGIRRLSGQGYTVLLSTHNPQHALSFADRVMALSDGRLAALGATGEVLDSKLMQTLYGVDVKVASVYGARVIVPFANDGEDGRQTTAKDITLKP